MSGDKFGKWFRAIRPFSFTGSVVPVVLGAMLALKESQFHFGYFMLSVIAIVLLHAGVNLLSDHDDFINHVDTKDSHGSSGVIHENLLSPKEVYKGGFIFLTLGSLVGLFLSYERGWLVLVFGLIGAIGGYSYTGKPLVLKYRGLGAPLVFLLFGPLMVLGAYYVQVQTISSTAFFVSIPVGLLTTAILHANDIRDIQHDKKAGINTLSIMVGQRNAFRIYYWLILLSYIAVFLMTFYKIIPYWSLLCLITVPSAVKNIQKLNSSYDSITKIVVLDKETAQLHAQFGSMFILSILLSLIRI